MARVVTPNSRASSPIVKLGDAATRSGCRARDRTAAAGIANTLPIDVYVKCESVERMATMNALERQLDYPFGETLPERGSTIEVAPGVLWTRMGLPFALDHINLW